MAEKKISWKEVVEKMDPEYKNPKPGYFFNGKPFYTPSNKNARRRKV
tara:strand:+ start:221 stop:361 length:141 start_codon:yes stop_codon:yes gene_type:complete